MHACAQTPYMEDWTFSCFHLSCDTFSNFYSFLFRIKSQLKVAYQSDAYKKSSKVVF